MTATTVTFVSSEAKVADQARNGAFLRAYGEAWGQALREVYVRLIVHNEPRQQVRTSLIQPHLSKNERPWREDEADSIIDTALAMQQGAIESTTLALDNARRALEEVERKLDWAMRGTSPKRRRQRHGLARRRDILAVRVARLEHRLEREDVRVIFGGRTLALAGNDPIAHGYKSRRQWHKCWTRARSGMIYVKGDVEANYANACAQVILADEPGGTDRLRLHVPNVVDARGRRLRDLAKGQEWIEIACTGFCYGRDEIQAAQVPAESADEARTRWQADRDWWPRVEPWHDEASALAEVHEHHLGHRPTWARRLPTPPPMTPYKAKRASAPVSVRICWREQKRAWYVVASCTPVDPELVLRPSRALRRRYAYILGIDLNPDHVAWCVVNRDGNPVAFGRIPLDLAGSADQNSDAIGHAVAEIARIATHYDAPVAHELLDFTKSRANLRYGCSRRLSRLLSSFAYHRFFTTLASRCRRARIERIPVNPAWTSVLGQANYAGVHGVSVDQGAACVIARRALGLRTRVRPQVAHAVSRMRAAGHTSPASPGLKLVAKALPKRRSTWEPSGLCLRGHSALTAGSRSGVGPHGVMVATTAGDVPAVGSQPAPTLASGQPMPAARQSHAAVPLPPRPGSRTHGTGVTGCVQDRPGMAEIGRCRE